MLKHGEENELHGIATLVGKVLPAFYPQLSYVEEGWFIMRNEAGQNLVVVSPDGTLTLTANSIACHSIEIKCPHNEKNMCLQYIISSQPITSPKFCLK
jgi:hypothetical protein